jgi:Spy/CpxP family protein refolding chaperone
MKFPQIRRFFLVGVLLVSPLSDAASPSLSPTPDAYEHQARPPKTLSDQEIAGYLAGEGMGMALAAELNRYPGPKHVLELADQLALDPSQRAVTQQLFQDMQTDARRLGRALVAKGQALDHLFETQRITDETLQRLTQEIGALRGELRYVHLRTHLQMRGLLSTEQQQTYQALGGRAAHPAPATHDGQHRHDADHH